MDTIQIKQLDKKLFGDPSRIESILDGEFRPINFFYSNVFEYKFKPFTGVATGLSKRKNKIVIELKQGRIQHIREYFLQGNLGYKFDRIDADTLLAVDSSFNFGLWRYTSRLIFQNGKMKLNFEAPYHRMYNGIFPACDKGAFCTDDGWSYIEMREGFQCEPTKRGWRQGDREPQIEGTHWTEFSFDSVLIATFFSDDEDRKQGMYFEFWPNGRQAAFGNYEDDWKSGHWTYHDSTGLLIREEWHSLSGYSPDEYNMDSVKTYYPDSSLRAIERRTWCATRVYYSSDSTDYEVNWKYKYFQFEFYPDGKRKVLQQQDCYRIDTLLAYWYPGGQLSHIELSDQTSFEYYANGQIKSTGLRFFIYGSRQGDVKEFDSTGVLFVDRTYVDGKAVAVRDSFGAIKNERRSHLSDSLSGAAVIGCFPENYVSTGVNQHWLNYGKSNIPAWKDSVFIPQGVVDSLSYAVAGAFMIFPDSLRERRDSIFEYAAAFHPSDSVWIYTVSMGIPDTNAWIAQCKSGKLWTANAITDKYFAQVGYEIVSWKVLGNPYGQVWDSGRYVAHYWCAAVISVKRPLNFIYFKQLDTDGYHQVQIKCGDETDYFYGYRLSRRCRKDHNNPREDQECIDENYLTFYIQYKSNQYERFQNRYFFIINSDSEVDLKFHVNEYNYSWYGEDNSFKLFK